MVLKPGSAVPESAVCMVIVRINTIVLMVRGTWDCSCMQSRRCLPNRLEVIGNIWGSWTLWSSSSYTSSLAGQQCSLMLHTKTNALIAIGWPLMPTIVTGCQFTVVRAYNLIEACLVMSSFKPTSSYDLHIPVQT